MRSFRRVDGTVQYLLPQVVAKERKLIQRCSKNFPNEIETSTSQSVRARANTAKSIVPAKSSLLRMRAAFSSPSSSSPLSCESFSKRIVFSSKKTHSSSRRRRRILLLLLLLLIDSYEGMGLFRSARWCAVRRPPRCRMRTSTKWSRRNRRCHQRPREQRR